MGHWPMIQPLKTDWPAIAPDVVRTLLGPPNPDASSRKELRWGKRGSFALTLDSGRWRDYKSGRSGGVLDLVERETGADRAGALEWLKSRGFLEIDRTGLHQRPIQPLSAGRTHETPPTTPQPPATATMRRRKALPGGWWDAAKPIPDDVDHAARRWMNRRNLWRMELPPPSALRWLPAQAPVWRGQHTGAGALVALMATPSAWAAAWPGLPAAQAVQLVNVNAEGAPALDRPADVKGLEKRTHGSTVGAVAIFGNPALALAFAPVRVAEGIADALALAARYEGPAVATLGTAGLRDQTETLTNWLTNAPRGVMVHADDDANAAGAEAARVLCRRIRLNGAEARAVFPPTGKDAAEAASRRPFADLQGYFAEYAETLRVMYPDWPRWEIARVAAIATEEL